jgi:hypothetical protein
VAAILSELANLAEVLRLRLVRALLPPESQHRVTVVPAGPPFAASSYARARLLRQLRACPRVVSRDQLDSRVSVDFRGSNARTRV